MVSYMRIVGILFVLSMVMMPVDAFTADSLDIVVLPNGDAVVMFEYSLSWLERMAVSLHATDPAQEIKKAIANNLNKEVTQVNVQRTTGPFSQSLSNIEDNMVYIPLSNETISKSKGTILTLGIKQFATVKKFNKTNETVTSKSTGNPVKGGENYIELEPDEEPIVISTNELSFADAENLINQLWFAPLINIDFSPSVTRISLPNEYSEKFYNQINIPSRKYATGSYITQNSTTDNGGLLYLRSYSWIRTCPDGITQEYFSYIEDGGHSYWKHDGCSGVYTESYY